MAKGKQKNEETIIYKTLHRKPTIEQHEPRLKSGVNAGDPEG